MADVYLGTNVGFQPADVILRPSAVVTTSTAGGNLRRHMGKSAGRPRQIQRFIRYRWTLTLTIRGHVSAPLALTPPPNHLDAPHTRTPIHIRAPRLRHTTHIHTTTHLAPPTTQLLNNDDEDLLLLLDIL